LYWALHARSAKVAPIQAEQSLVTAAAVTE
jgi:hypothetical protein